jgi:hypothetical protein
VLFLRNGLWFWKKPLFFFATRFSGSTAIGSSLTGSTLTGSTLAGFTLGDSTLIGSALTGDTLPLGGSWLENDVGFEYSLLSSGAEMFELFAEFMAS